MSLIFNPSSGFAYLETEEAVPWASLGGRAYTHFILLETTASKDVSQYVWSTGNYLAANALNMYFSVPGLLYASAGPSSAEVPADALSPAFGGGLLRLAVIRGIGEENSNSAVDYQSVNLGILPGSSSVQISNGPIIKYTTNGSDSFAATKLTLGDRQTTPGARKFFGTMHFAGSVNRALDDNELIAILKGDIQVLDYFKHNLVELWDFQRGDDAALTGLISGTTLKKFGGSNLIWTPDAPLPVSRTRGHTTLGATNRSVLVPVWAYGESSSGSEVINTAPEAIALSPVQAGLYSTEILNTQADALLLTPVSASILDTVSVLTNPANTVLSGVSAAVRLSEAIQAKPASIALTGDRADVILKEALYAKPAIIDLTGVQASIAGSMTISAKPATIDLTGVNASINLSGQIQIDAKVATATLVARSATFAQHAVVNAQPDTLVLSPVVAGIYAGEAVVDAKAQALTLSPNQATIVQHGVLSTTPDNIALHGSKAELHLTNVLTTNKANVSLYGTPAGLYSTEILSGKPDSITLQGSQALIRSDGVGVIDTWPDNIGIFGQKADISMRTMLAANPASMLFDGLRAQITYESPVVWGSMTIEARLQSMTIEARQ